MQINVISLDIYENKSVSNCSNNGISKRFKEIYIACKTGPDKLDSENLPENFCVIKETMGHKYLVPKYLADAGTWTMMGGSYAGTSDSRFGEILGEIAPRPLPIHDRVETQGEYNALSQ